MQGVRRGAHRGFCGLMTASLVLTVSIGSSLPAFAQDEALPSFAKVRSTTERLFKSEDLEPGDILARSEVEPLFKILKRIGWNVPGYKSIIKAVHKDSDFLVQTLRTEDGRRFAQKVAGYPRGFDMLDRLSKMPHGRATIEALVRGPDGQKMVEYLSTTGGGNELGKMLSDAPAGKDFNDPTRRIYTADQLLRVLEFKYAETLEKLNSQGVK